MENRDWMDGWEEHGVNVYSFYSIQAVLFLLPTYFSLHGD